MARARSSDAGLVLVLAVVLLAAAGGKRSGGAAPAPAGRGSALVFQLYKDAPDLGELWNVALAALERDFGTVVVPGYGPVPALSNRWALAVYWGGVQFARQLGLSGMPKAMRAAAWEAAGADRGYTILSPWNLTSAQLDAQADPDVLREILAGWVSLVIEGMKRKGQAPTQITFNAGDGDMIACAEYEVRHFQQQANNPPNFSTHIIYPTTST